MLNEYVERAVSKPVDIEDYVRKIAEYIERVALNPVDIEDYVREIAECAAKKAVGYYGYLNASEVNEIVTKLKEKGFRPTQRPHHRLPALMTHWDSLLKKSGYPVVWLSKRVKGRRTVVRAVVGAYFTENGNELEYCIKLFGDFETKEYERRSY